MSSTVSIAAKSTESGAVSDESPLWLQLQSELGGLRHACEHLSSALLAEPHRMRHELSRLLGLVHTIAGSKYAPEDRSPLCTVKAMLRELADELEHLSALAVAGSENNAPLIQPAAGLVGRPARTSNTPGLGPMSRLRIATVVWNERRIQPCADQFLDACRELSELGMQEFVNKKLILVSGSMPAPEFIVA
jgi:hypothetical protein